MNMEMWMTFYRCVTQINKLLQNSYQLFLPNFLFLRDCTGNKLLTGIKQHRVVTRTRGIVLRIFEAICNCTNSATLPGQRPATAPANLGASSSRN